MKAWINFLTDRLSRSRRCLSSLFLELGEPGEGARVLRSFFNSIAWKQPFLWNYGYLVILTSRLVNNAYSHFEKGCRIKCSRQPRKVLWVALSSLFFKEIWKNGRRIHGHMSAIAKGKQKKTGKVYWTYPILPFGLSRAHFSHNLVRNSCIYLTDFLKPNLSKSAVIWVKRRQKAGFLRAKNSKITVTKGKERRKRKSEEKERTTRKKSNGCTISFYNGYFGFVAEKTVGRKRSIWR